MALSAKGKVKGQHRAYIQQAIATTGSSAGSGEPSIRGGRQIREAIMTQFRAALTARDTGQVFLMSTSRKVGTMKRRPVVGMVALAEHGQPAAVLPLERRA
jgi:hypothetical protein